jgi:ectoine hydroxylase-related dioxygenase (phytanoyl-CoA dioxygenase family)
MPNRIPETWIQAIARYQAAATNQSSSVHASSHGPHRPHDARTEPCTERPIEDGRDGPLSRGQPTHGFDNAQKRASWNDRRAGASSSRDPLCERFAAQRSAFLRDGYVVLRGVLPPEMLAAVQADLERVVDGYAERLKTAGKLGGLDGRHDTSAGLPFRERYTELYRANKFGPHNRGMRSDLPAFFRKEGHTAGIYALISDPQIFELARCMLPSMPPRGQPLRLYPVYMLRGKVPAAIAGPADFVDWHQDAQYTYYWYSERNTTRAQMDEYAQSLVNFWVPVTDTTHELGPMQFARRPSHAPRGALTRADLRCKGCGEAGPRRQPARAEPSVPQGRHGDRVDRVEFLRLADIDAYAGADHSRLEAMSPLRRGDVVLFDQYAYHRGLPNQTPNATRWSLDFRYQDAVADTLRSEGGFFVAPRAAAAPEMAAARRPGAGAGAGTPFIRSAEDWAAATPSFRLSDLRHATGNPRLGGHDWAAQHADAGTLRSAVDLDRGGYAATEASADARACHGRRLRSAPASRFRPPRAKLAGSLLPDKRSQHD